MALLYQYLVHTDGPALWPEHKPLKEVEKLRDTTPQPIWQSTYQGNTAVSGGAIFERAWWLGKNRYDASDPTIPYKAIAYYLSWDTGMKDKVTNAYTARVAGFLMPDYRLIIRNVFRDRITFPGLPPTIAQDAEAFRHMGRDVRKLRNVLIEDKASGISATQTLRATADPWLADIITPFQPIGDKSQRAEQAAVWCQNGSVLLPEPGPDVPWLLDFEDELFLAPQSEFMDQVDAFSQLVLFVERLLEAGFHARGGLRLAA